jgi:hypothetical protein
VCFVIIISLCQVQLTNVAKPLHSFQGAGPSTVVGLAAVIADLSTKSERAILAQTINLDGFEALKSRMDKRSKQQGNSGKQKAKKTSKLKQESEDDDGGGDEDEDEDDDDNVDDEGGADPEVKKAQRDADGDGTGADKEVLASRITLSTLDSNMSNVAVSEAECASYCTDQATLQALAHHPFQGLHEIMGILEHEK